MNLIEDKKIILNKLKSAKFVEFISKFNIYTVVVFGSICNDEFNELSDVDIAILEKDKILLDSILERLMYYHESKKTFKNNRRLIDIKNQVMKSYLSILSSAKIELIQ